MESISSEDKQREYARKWREANPEKNRESSRNWRKANPAKANAQSRKWRQAFPSETLEHGRRWRKANPAKVRDKERRHRARKKGCVVSAAEVFVVVEASRGVCALCRTYVPQEFRHIDHIIPLDKGGPHSQNNLQLLCYRCNTSKGAKMPEDVTPETWVAKPDPDQPFLLNPNWK